MNKSDYHVFFSYSQGIGPKTFLKLLLRFGSAENIYNASKDELEIAGLKGKNLEKYLEFKDKFDISKVISEIQKKGIWVISYDSFPEKLKNIKNPPIVIFGKGNKDLIFETNSIGIVGSRKPTEYGVSVTKKFTEELVRVDFVIISGMALGIDAISHKETLKNNGKTIAVLGSGVDLPTPSENYNLYQDILKNNGAVISEFPLGMRPNKGSFPARNRIISALSEAILIPEATSDSGALITANEAFMQNRKVFVVPGPITSPLSQGTNHLIKNGGIAISNVDEILDELKVEANRHRPKVSNQILSKEDDKIVKLLEKEALSADLISRRLKVSVGDLMVKLSELELRGIVENIDGKWNLKV